MKWDDFKFCQMTKECDVLKFNAQLQLKSLEHEPTLVLISASSLTTFFLRCRYRNSSSSYQGD